MALRWIVEIAPLAMAGCEHGFGHDRQFFGREPTVWLVKGLFGPDSVGQQLHGSQDADVFTFEGYTSTSAPTPWTWPTPRSLTASSRPCCGYTRPTTTSSTAFGLQRPRRVWRCRGPAEQIARVHLGALAQAVLLGRREYFAVLRDHAVATARDPAGTELVSQYQDPKRIFVQHNQRDRYLRIAQYYRELTDTEPVVPGVAKPANIQAWAS